jgi:hypothetical protein
MWLIFSNYDILAPKKTAMLTLFEQKAYWPIVVLSCRDRQNEDVSGEIQTHNLSNSETHTRVLPLPNRLQMLVAGVCQGSCVVVVMGQTKCSTIPWWYIMVSDYHAPQHEWQVLRLYLFHLSICLAAVSGPRGLFWTFLLRNMEPEHVTLNHSKRKKTHGNDYRMCPFKKPF